MLPYNVDVGIVFSGFRHINCICQMYAITGKRNSEVGNSIQGFLTNKNKFVDRQEGAEIALVSRQIDRLQYGSMLYSEDLY
jgi:hypothetical protein